MAEHNFTAGVEMTMTNVVNNYLRWFRLNTTKRALGQAARGKHASPNWRVQPALVTQNNDDTMDSTPTIDANPSLAESGELEASYAMRASNSAEGH